MDIKVKYFDKDYPRIEKIAKGDWIDLRVDSLKTFIDCDLGTLGVGDEIWDLKDNPISYRKGDVMKFGLGVAMELPNGYEAIVAPRSSTFKHWGLIQTNGIGIIDNTYCGDNDEWCIEFIAMRDGEINRFDRVCQFRIQENQPKIEIKEVKHLGNKDRGGYGSTGRK